MISDAHFFLAVFAGNPCRLCSRARGARVYMRGEASNKTVACRREAGRRPSWAGGPAGASWNRADGFVSGDMRLDRHGIAMQTSCRIVGVMDHDADQKCVIRVNVLSF